MSFNLLSSLYKPVNLKKATLVFRPILKLENYLSDDFIGTIQRNLILRSSLQEAESVCAKLRSYQDAVREIIQIKPKREKILEKIRIIEDTYSDFATYANFRPQESSLKKDLDDLCEKEDQLTSHVIPFILSLPNRVDTEFAGENLEVIKTSSEPLQYSFKIQNHVKLSYINFGHYSTIIGPHSKFCLNDGAKIIIKLKKFFAAQCNSRGYIEFNGMDFVKTAIIEACRGSQERDLFKDTLRIIGTDNESLNQKIHLVGEASLESIIGFLSQKFINPNALPLKVMAIGARYEPSLEQVNTIQCVVWLMNDGSKVREELLSMVDFFWTCYQKLGIPCRLIRAPAKSLRNNESSRHEIQLWFPYSKTWKTCSHVSNHEKFTPQRIDKDNASLLEGSLVNFDLLLASLMENLQKEDGSFGLPAILEEGAALVAESSEDEDNAKNNRSENEKEERNR